MSISSLGFLGVEAGPSRTLNTSGTWHPLPYIYSGFIIHPYRSSARVPLPATPTGASTSPVSRNRFSWSGIPSGQRTSSRAEPNIGNIHELSVDVGDEFFAFEEYKCSTEEDGKGDVWYRGFVVPPVSLKDLVPSLSSSNVPPRLDTKVNIGIFPAAVTHIRPGAINDDGTLAEAFTEAVRQAEAKLDAQTSNPPWTRELEGVREEDEEVEGYTISSPAGASSHKGEIVDVFSSPKTAVSRSNGVTRNRPKSLIMDPSKVSPHTTKSQPPVPTITAGDSTAAGQVWPLVDEIACAIREWHERLPTYLANREYRLFDIVVQHIDCLFVGRRQLLSQTHSEDELGQVRRECVSRLVKCNVAQGLEVIVRSLDDGSVLVVDKDRAFTGSNWISGIAAYVYQVQLAYIDLIPLDTLFGKPTTPTPVVRSLVSHHPVKQFSLSTARATKSANATPTGGSFSHLLLDVRAFLANPCAQGETAELYFSLYSASEGRFITEEFCLILNHLGAPARDSDQRLGRLRTLFTELKTEDLQKSVCLVCRIIRNGAMKMKSDNLVVNGDLTRKSSNARGSRNDLLSQFATNRRTSSILDSATDDSFSVTSGFGATRTNTALTGVTSMTSVIDGRPSFRRPFGCAVLSLPSSNQLLREGELAGPSSEFSMPIYVPCEEDQFATLHEEIIIGNNRAYQVHPKAESIAISLKVLQGSLAQVTNDHPSIMQDATQSSRLGFPDIAYPGARRNDCYIKLDMGSFGASAAVNNGSLRSRKSVMNALHDDVQVSVEVRRSDGTVVADAIHAGGSGEPPMPAYHSMVIHHTEKPRYGELLKLVLHPEIGDCHLFLSFRHRTRDRPVNAEASELEKPFGFAYLPLLSADPATLATKDGSHELNLYKMENNLQPQPNIYFSAPASGNVNLPPALYKSLSPLRDRMSVTTLLCSNIHTTDDTLRKLFNRPAGLDPQELSSLLQMFNFVDEEEIAKFVPKVLDGLFGIMTSNLGDRQDEVDTLVFNALVKVLAMNSDRRFANFGTVLDLYISNHFSYAASSAHLLKAMKTVMSDPTTKDYRSFLKVWHLVFRFIIRSRSLDRSRGIGLDATSAHIEADFLRQTKAILGDINTLMKSTDKTLIGTQTLAVQHYADVLPHLSQVFSSLEIAEIVIAFADTLTMSKGSIAVYKLLLLLQVVNTSFSTAETRALLVPAIVRWVKPHLGRYEALGVGEAVENQSVRDGRKVKWLECNRLAVTVVACMINKLQEWHMSPLVQEDEQLKIQEEDNIEYCLSLLPPLVASYTELSHPSALAVLSRYRTTAPNIWKQTPDVFPMSHPFALIAELPPPSLLDRHHNTDEAGLSSTGTFNCGLAEVAVVILSMIYVTPPGNMQRWLLEMLDLEGIDTCASTMILIVQFAKSVIGFKAFPSRWLTLSLMAHGAIVRFIETTSNVLLREEFIPPTERSKDFKTPLWLECLELLCDLCGAEALALEEHTHQRRRAGWIIAGDLREDGVALLSRLWNALGSAADEQPDGQRHGGYQTRFGSLAGRILGLCLSGHDETCRSAVEILFSMIYAEYIVKGKFDSIETEVLSKLDSLFSSKANSSTEPAARAWFVSELRVVFETTPAIDEVFQSKVSLFLEEIELFIALLENVRELPQTPEWADERAAATYQMLEFIRRLNRQELYIRFIHQMKKTYIDNGNWTSAGLCLKLHAEVYDWKVGGDWVESYEKEGFNLPGQTQFARKEALYYHAMDYFAESHAYEHALELAQELVTQHQNLTFDVARLSELLIYQSKLWDQMAQMPRPKPEYYRVAFYGEMKPSFNQGKDLIMRGRPWQLYSEFCDDIQHKYPLAQLHRSKTPPSPPLRAGGDPVIWVTPVSPEPDATLPIFNNEIEINENIRQWHKYNNIRTFSSTRPYKVHSPAPNSKKEYGEAGERTGGLMTWLEKTIITTKEALPGILNRSEVVEVKYVHLSPISVAIGEVSNATKNLRTLASGGPSKQPDIKQLGTAINGAVDSPVSGGVKLYKNTFLSIEYSKIYPDDATDVENLRCGLLEYAGAIQDALTIHRHGCKDMVFHEALRSHFMRSFKDEIAHLPRLSLSDSSFTTQPFLNGSQLGNSPRPSNVSRPSITITGANYALPPLRVGPASSANQPSVVVSAPGSLNSTTPFGSPTSNKMKSPTSRSPVSSPSASLPTFNSRAMSIIGSVSNRSNLTVEGVGAVVNTNGNGSGGPSRRGSTDTSGAGSSLTSIGERAGTPTSSGGNKGLGIGDIGDGDATVSRKKGNRLSRLGSLMRKG